MTATINNFGGYYRTEIYVHEARRWGAIIEAPSLNEGAFECILIGKRLILGFILVAGIEAQLVVPIIDERRKNGRFKTFEDLMRRCHIPLEQLALLIRIGALRDFDDDRKTLLWKAHFHHQHQLVKSKTVELFETPFVRHEIPKLEENGAESTFEQIELLGFSLCNPFDLLDESLPSHTFASELAQCLGTKIEMYGYLVAIKQSRTSKGDIMNFGTFIDKNGDTIDTVHFPESVRKFPFYGKGIYRLVGVITEEFGYFSLEVGQMEKLRLMDDVRFGDVEKIENPSTHKEAS
jgi:DNA polymerase-3 subunit alpha